MRDTNGKTALLVMDLQNGIVSRYAENEKTLLPFQKAVHAARQNGIPVIFIPLGSAKDTPR